MQSIGIYEAKSRFSALVEMVEQGEEVRITRHGKEVVRMLPMRRKPVITDEQIARELEQISALQQTVKAQAATNRS
jgi:prevent-host-death family protein